MTNYSNFCNGQELLKMRTRDDETKKIKYPFENSDHENILKSLNLDNKHYKTKYK